MKKILACAFTLGIVVSIAYYYPQPTAANNSPRHPSVQQVKEKIKSGELEKVDFDLTVRKEGKVIWTGDHSKWVKVKDKILKKYNIGKYASKDKQHSNKKKKVTEK